MREDGCDGFDCGEWESAIGVAECLDAAGCSTWLPMARADDKKCG